MKRVLFTTAVLILGCGGPVANERPAPVTVEEPVPEPSAAPAADPTRKLAEQLVADELAPPDTGPRPEVDEAARAARVQAVQAFLEAHPDPDWVPLVTETVRCGTPVEEAFGEYERRRVEPRELEVSAQPYRVVVLLGRSCGTSEDWGWFTAQVIKSLDGVGIVSASVDPPETLLRLTRDSQTLETVDLQAHLEEGVGYLALQEGQEPVMVGHDAVENVVGALSEYFGTPIPVVEL